MKLTNEKTDSIIIKADNCSEWDYCNTVLVQDINTETLETWKKYDKIATDLKSTTVREFESLNIWEWSTFLNLDKDKREYEEYMKWGKLWWSYVTDVTEEEIEEQKPEQIVDCLQLRFYGNGEVCFLGYGKHTGEEFYSQSININEL